MTLLLGIVSILAAFGAIGVIASPQPLYSALSLVWTIAMLSVLYLVLNAQFLFAVQMIVYAGAVMVLFVFIIALLSPTSEDRPTLGIRSLVAAIGVVALTVTFVLAAHNGITYDSAGRFHGAQIGAANDPYHAFAFNPIDVNADSAGNVQTVAGQLFTTFLLPFEITSLLLLVAAIGAVYLTRRIPRTSN